MNEYLCSYPPSGTWRTTYAANAYWYLGYLGSLKETTVEVVSDEPPFNQVARYFTQSSQRELSRIASFPENWDGSGSLKPSALAVANASARLPEIYRISMLTGRWVAPHIGASESGEITFEWWNGIRKVTMYFGDYSVDVIRVWGINIDSEMHLAHVDQIAELAPVWAWLYGN
jgi:hypothetical protein